MLICYCTISDLSSQQVISEGLDESIEKIAIDEPQAYIEVLQSEPIDAKFNCLDTFKNDVADDSDTESLSPIYGFSPNDTNTLLNVNRILDLMTVLRYRCDPKHIWAPEPPILYKKRNHTTMEKMEDNDIAGDDSRCTTPQRVPKRRRQK